MASGPSERGRRAANGGSPAPSLAPLPPTLKILVTGGPGTGTSSLIRALGTAHILRTEVPRDGGTAVAAEAAPVSPPQARPGSGPPAASGEWGPGYPVTVTTEFGRIAAGRAERACTVYLFGLPVTEGSGFLWDGIAQGALGAVVLADTRCLDASFPALDRCERLGLPCLVAVNCFPGAATHTAREVARALDLEDGTPVVLCDVRDRDAVKEVLVRLIEYTAGRQMTGAGLRSVPFFGDTEVTGATGV